MTVTFNKIDLSYFVLFIQLPDSAVPGRVAQVHVGQANRQNV